MKSLGAFDTTETQSLEVQLFVLNLMGPANLGFGEWNIIVMGVKYFLTWSHGGRKSILTERFLISGELSVV